MYYLSLIVTTKGKPMIDSQKIKRRESKHTTMGNYQFTNKCSKRKRKERGNYKTSRKR